MFLKLKQLLSSVFKPLYLAVFALIIGAAGIAIYQQSSAVNTNMPAQGQETLPPDEQKKNAALINEILERKKLPVYAAFAPTKEQQTAFFAGYPAKLSEIPAPIKKACVHYVGHLHPEVLKIAQLAAQNMGITEPIFFYETASVCHAMTGNGFSRLGLHLSYMLAVHPDYSDKLKPTAKEALIDYFFRHLYHELHHIKYKDDSCRIADVSGEEANLLGRHCEMRAELGGLWGAHEFHERDLQMKTFYPKDDGSHPTAEDQLRYNKLLHEAIDEHQDTNPMIIELLAHQYLAEKSPVLIAKLEKAAPGSFSTATA